MRGSQRQYKKTDREREKRQERIADGNRERRGDIRRGRVMQ